VIISVIALGLLSLGIRPVKAVVLKWDLNGDEVIDIKDLAEAGKAFSTVNGSARWNSRADVVEDGKVDIKDISTIAKHFGERVVKLVVPEFWMGTALGLAGLFAGLGAFSAYKWKKQ
jgi:hypothetical protein